MQPVNSSRDLIGILPSTIYTVMAIDPPITIKSLRALKNTIIGNPSAKSSLAQDDYFVRVSVSNPFKLFREIDDHSYLTPVSSAV